MARIIIGDIEESVGVEEQVRGADVGEERNGFTVVGDSTHSVAVVFRDVEDPLGIKSDPGDALKARSHHGNGSTVARLVFVAHDRSIGLVGHVERSVVELDSVPSAVATFDDPRLAHDSIRSDRFEWSRPVLMVEVEVALYESLGLCRTRERDGGDCACADVAFENFTLVVHDSPPR